MYVMKFIFRQFDLRAPHNCFNGPSQILINLLSHAGNHSEVQKK